MRKLGAMTGILFAGLLLWGCGESEANEYENAEAASAVSTEVLKDGSIVETITEEFDETYYDQEDLKNMALSEVADFNRNAGENDISVDKLESKNGKITMRMKYPSAEIYTAYNTDAYNKRTLFCGTVSEAYEAGYSLDISLQDIKNGNEIGKEELLQMGDKNIFISEESMSVKVPGKILYVSQNVTVNGKSRADISAAEDGEKYYVVYK